MAVTVLSILFLALSITCAHSARVLDEDPEVAVPISSPGDEKPDSVPLTGGANGATAAQTAAGTGDTVKGGDSRNTLTFFMHDIVGGSNPTARAVTGAVTNRALNGQVPFAKPNGAVLPGNNNIPSNGNNNGIMNNNNLPFLTGLGGSRTNLIQNSGNNINNNNNHGMPVLNAAQVPAGMTLQNLMFGTMTVIDDELTEGHDLGSGLIGKAQGFYVASSLDGNSMSLAFTAMFESGGYTDSISFFGVHRTAVSESQLAVMGGTGKYVNAKGHATVKTNPTTTTTSQNATDGGSQNGTDGVETLVQFTVYLAYY